MSRMMTYITAFSVLIACSPGALARDSRAPDSEDGTVTSAVAVSYGDLDLSQPGGVDMLLRRVRSASADVCGSPSPLNHRLVQLSERCRYRAATDGLRQLGNPDVMMEFEKQSGRTALYASR